MTKDDRCPYCGVHDHNNNANVCANCSLPYELWPWARRITAQAEIGSRAVEALPIIAGALCGTAHGHGCGCYLDTTYGKVSLLLADARAARMVP